MDVEKLLIQDSPPTRKEFDALNQGVKNWTMYALVDRYAIPVQSIQRKPYTAVQIAFNAHPEPGKDMYTGEGFSKVVWPDEFCADTGFRLARVRAIRQIVKALIRDDMAHVVLTDKWNRYLDTAEKHRLNAIAEAELNVEDAEVGVDQAEEGKDRLGVILVQTAGPQMR